MQNANLIIADEPTSALDVVVQRQVMETLKEAQREIGASVILVGHDMGLMAQFAERLGVMYAGRLMEVAPIREIFNNPRHPYTRGLLSSIPTLDSPHKQPLRVIEGIVPSLDDLPAGCRFENRCPHARAICATAPPPLVEVGPEHFASCYFATELDSWENVSAQEKTA